MHRIMENGVEKKVSFDTWQKHTNVRYEDDKGSTTKIAEKSSETGSRKVVTKFHPVRPKNKSSATLTLTRTKSTSKPRVSITPGTSHPEKERTSNPIAGGGSGVRGSKEGRRRSSGRQSLTIDPKHFVIGSSPRREIIGGSHYSRALLVNAHPLTQGPGPENLQYLQNVDHLFFKKCKKFPPEIKDFNPKEKRGIWNAGGRCVYYVGLTSYYRFDRRLQSGFTYQVVDYLGRPVLTSVGRQWIFGIKGSVTVTLGNNNVLGIMEQEMFGSLYNIRDRQGRIVYTIQAPCYAPAVPFVVWCFKEEFEICMDDTISEIGRITSGWGDEFPEFDGDLGLEFETADDNRVKALLLGVYFLIEFQYFKYGGNGRAYFAVMVIGVTLLSFVLSNGFGFLPQIKSPLMPGT